MQDPFAGELVAAALGDPQMQQPVPLARAAVQAARVPASGMSDADEHAVVAADRTGPPAAGRRGTAAGSRSQAAREAPGAGQAAWSARHAQGGGAGKLAAQWRAMSSRRVTQTPSWRLDVVEQSFQARRSRGMADDPHVQADREHFRLGRALAIQEVERVAAVMKEVVAGREHAAAELRIVGGHRVGDDQMRLALDPGPVRQFVVVGVGIVEKPAFLDDQPPRVHAGPAAAIPAERTLPHGRLDRGDGAGDAGAFGWPRRVRSAFPSASRDSKCRARRL